MVVNSRKVSLIITIATLTAIIATYVPTVNASSKSPYESGYDHGCNDADISDPDDRYINQPEKGPSFHTNEFMRGYNDGYDTCSDNQSGSSNGRDGNEGGGWNDSCYDAGYDDGENNPFNHDTYDHCADEEGGDQAYYDGFIDGCMSVEGNTRDVCESATDA